MYRVFPPQIIEYLNHGTGPDQERDPFPGKGCAQILEALQGELEVGRRELIRAEPDIFDHKQTDSRSGLERLGQGLMVFGPEIPLEPDQMKGRRLGAHLV